MIKKSLWLLIMLLALLCGGCWNYRSLGDMSIVSGFAIDMDKETGLYKVSFQIVDLSGNIKVEGINAKILESEGSTLFDACRNAKKTIIGKLYFGHTQLVVINEDLAREKDLRILIDWMLHDAEIRETLQLVISTEATAEDILKYETLVGPISAFDVTKVIEDDSDITSSTSYKQLYEVYSELESEGIELTLPAVRNRNNNGEYIAELCGTAVYKGERLIGFLTSEESKYFLFAVDKVKGGLFSFPAYGDGQDNVTLEISDNKTSRSFTYKDGKLVIILKPETDVFLTECEVSVDAMDKQQIEELETNAAKALADRMVQTIQNVQSRFGSDIFGFGNIIHTTDNTLWKKLSKDWDTIFPTLEVQVNAKVNIVNSACINK